MMKSLEKNLEKAIDWIISEMKADGFSKPRGERVRVPTWIRGDDWLTHKGSVGKFIRDARVRVLNDRGLDCEPGEIGEVYLMPAGGPGSTYHYIGAEAKSVDGGWETLGDMGWLDKDGYLYLADRRTDLIISGGANIYPAEVEAALAEHPSVDSAVAIGIPDDDLGQIVHAIVHIQKYWQEEVGESELRNFLLERLAQYKTPRTYEFVEYSLRDDAGKVRRSEFRERRIEELRTGGGPEVV